MQVKSLIEKALYLSIKDRMFDTLPRDDATKTRYLATFLDDLNSVLEGIGKKNPAYSHFNINTQDLKVDKDLNVSYIDLKFSPFLTLFSVEFLKSGSFVSLSLERLGVSDFFEQATVRSCRSSPIFYNYNVFSNRLYIYPTPSSSGSINLFGKQKIGLNHKGKFESIDDYFPDFVSEMFLFYATYFFAKHLCSIYNAPWQAQKEDLLKNYGRLVDSENNISYQTLSKNDGKSGMPFRNVRIE